MQQTDDEGLTLIEVVVAMGILLIAAVCMLPSFAATAQLAARNELVNRASHLATSQLSLASEQALTNPSCADIVSTLNSTAGLVQPDPQFTISRFADVADPEEAEARDATFTWDPHPTSAQKVDPNHMCPASGYPLMMSVTIDVTRNSTGENLTTTKTLVVVVEKVS